jgi:hypothetical protein
MTSLDITFNNIEFLVTHFSAMKAKFINNSQIYIRLLSAWYKFDKYYALADDTPVYAASVLLHPELREAYLRSVWAPRNKRYIKPAIESVKQLWVEHFKPQTPTAVISLDEIEDPVLRFRTELTRSVTITEEFDDFIKVNTKRFHVYKIS